jgi:hypothetical protein
METTLTPGTSSNPPGRSVNRCERHPIVSSTRSLLVGWRPPVPATPGSPASRDPWLPDSSARMRAGCGAPRGAMSERLVHPTTSRLLAAADGGKGMRRQRPAHDARSRRPRRARCRVATRPGHQRRATSTKKVADHATGPGGGSPYSPDRRRGRGLPDEHRRARGFLRCQPVGSGGRLASTSSAEMKTVSVVSHCEPLQPRSPRGPRHQSPYARVGRSIAGIGRLARAITT